MNPFLFNLAYKIASKMSVSKRNSNYETINERVRILIVNSSYYLKSIVYITLGIISYAFSVKSFLLPNDLIDGGGTGISLLMSIKTGLNLGLLILIINLPLMLLGRKQISKWFTLKSIISLSALSIIVYLFEFPKITNEPILATIFGGIFLGFGIGFTIRGGAVLDGIDLVALLMSKKIGFTVGGFIALFNSIIFAVAAYLLSLEQALYAILTYLAASKTADFVIEGVDEYTGVHIVSEYSNEIRLMIINKLGRGVTVLYGKRGFAKEGAEPEPIEMLYTVMTRLELSGLKKEVQKIDPDAFMTMVTINDIKGGMIKKRTIKD